MVDLRFAAQMMIVKKLSQMHQSTYAPLYMNITALTLMNMMEFAISN